MVGKTKMKDWKAAVRTWEKNGVNKGNGSAEKKSRTQIALEAINGVDYGTRMAHQDDEESPFTVDITQPRLLS
jgi:hypothetical protein